VMSTDGVDRSLRRAFGPDKTDQDPYGPEFSMIASAGSLNTLVLNELDRIEGREIDNLSVAVLRWPCPDFRSRPRPSTKARLPRAGKPLMRSMEGSIESITTATIGCEPPRLRGRHQ